MPLRPLRLQIVIFQKIILPVLMDNISAKLLTLSCQKWSSQPRILYHVKLSFKNEGSSLMTNDVEHHQITYWQFVYFL